MILDSNVCQLFTMTSIRLPLSGDRTGAHLARCPPARGAMGQPAAVPDCRAAAHALCDLRRGVRPECRAGQGPDELAASGNAADADAGGPGWLASVQPHGPRRQAREQGSATTAAR